MIRDKKVLVNILARAGSTGVKDKNIADVGGKPVLWYSVTEALKSKYADAICVSTDSEKYANHAAEKGGLVPFLRPKNISDDYSTDYEFFEHYINWAKENSCCPDLIAHIRPTTPLRDPEIIEKAIIFFINKV